MQKTRLCWLPYRNDRRRCAAGAGCDREKTDEEVVAIIEKWSNEHPIQTRQSEFLKMFPNAKIVNGHINICPKDADSKLRGLISCENSCTKCKDQYWLAEVE